MTTRVLVALKLAPDQVQPVAVLLAVKLLEAPLQISDEPFTVMVGVAVTVTVIFEGEELQELVVAITV